MSGPFRLKYENSAFPFKKDDKKKKVDPDAPGTPGEPGYEPPVKRSDLDEKGKAVWDANKIKEQIRQIEYLQLERLKQAKKNPIA